MLKHEETFEATICHFAYEVKDATETVNDHTLRIGGFETVVKTNQGMRRCAR